MTQEEFKEKLVNIDYPENDTPLNKLFDDVKECAKYAHCEDMFNVFTKERYEDCLEYLKSINNKIEKQGQCTDEVIHELNEKFNSMISGHNERDQIYIAYLFCALSIRNGLNKAYQLISSKINFRDSCISREIVLFLNDNRETANVLLAFFHLIKADPSLLN